MHTCFKLEIELRGSFARQHSMTADSMIGGMIWEKINTSDGDSEVLGKRSQSCDGLISYYDFNGTRIPMASDVILEKNFIKRKSSLTRNIGKNFRNAGGDRYLQHFSEKDRKVIKYGMTESTDAEYIIQSKFDVFETRYVSFYIRGDMNEIKLLVENAGFIGAKRGNGFGQIENVDVTEMEEDAFFGIVHFDNLVRPVPIEFSEYLLTENKIGSDQFVKIVGRYENPYNPSLAKRYGYDTGMVARPSFQFLDDGCFA